MTKSLCASCSGFVKSFGEVEDANWSHKLDVAPNIHSLRSQARNGCHLCQIIYQSCFYSHAVSGKHWDYPITIFASPPRSYNPYDVDYNEYRRMVYDTEEEDGLPFRNLRPRQLELSIYIGETAEGMVHYLPVVRNNDIRNEGGMSFAISNPSTPRGLQRILQSAKEWLLTCRNGHVGCSNSASSDKHVRPTRLIEVGSQVGERMPRLYIPSQDTRDIEYAALSYVWGGDHADFTKTTASNLNDMRRQLPCNKLSKTVQDAIIITRGLGLKYLWVDALCILQKEKINDVQHMEDWSIEAARFASYYQNAVLTIAATGSESSSRGLFLERPSLEFNPEPVAVLQKSYWTGFRESTIQPFYPDPISEIDNSVLLNRAWTTQERLLSERILHFGANCIFWECSGGYISELQPDRWDPLHETSEFFHFKNIHTFNTEELAELWYAFVTEYLLKDISVGSDRLPALSGVATLVSTRCQQKYIAGIWESSVAEGLTWIAISTSSIHNNDPIKSERVLPSWSWASNNGLIYFLFHRDPWESTIQVINFCSRSKGSETSGQVLEACLTLKGLFRMVDLSQLDLGYPLNENGKEESTEGNHQETLKHKHAAHIDDKKPAEPLGPQPRLCLLIGTIHEPEYDPWRKVKKGVTYVLEHSGRRYGEFEGYKRIGLVSLPFDEYWSEVKDVRTIELV